ncbi:MAG: hypothetical protein AB7H86_22660 [Blastocatellales bacterium]
MTRKQFGLTAILLIIFAMTATESRGQGSGKPVIWKDPGNVEKLDFVGGPGGRENAPAPPFAFIEENLSGTNPKLRIIDAKGVRWSVKFGTEIHSEVFATRLAWACGYFVDPSYFIASGKIDDLGKLTRAKNYVAADGSFKNARFERQREKGVKELDGEKGWSWIQNPFLGSPELNGLKIIMMLTSNWDNKDVRDARRGSNTSIYLYPNEDRYVVTDWGGSMGKWGGFVSREKWDCNGYTKQTPDFLKGVKGDNIVWGYSGQHTGDFISGIRISDARWLLNTLGRITDAQLREGLEASGASASEVDCFARAIRERINQIRECVGD